MLVTLLTCTYLWFARLAYYVMILCIQFYLNGGFHAIDSVPMVNISLPCSCYIMIQFYITMNVVQLPNKVTSFMISIIHSLASYGDSWPCWLPKIYCVVDISNWLFSPSQMSCYDVQSCLAFSEEHRWHSCFFAGIAWKGSTWLSTTQPPSYHVPATSGRLPTQAETSSSALSRQTVCWDTL